MFKKIDEMKQKGFTLIELMIVVAIIGILAAIAIPQFAAYRVKAFNSAAESDLRNMMTAEEATYADTQSYYPSTGTKTDIGGSATVLTTLGTLGGTSGGAKVSKNVGFSITGDAVTSGASYAIYTGHQKGDTVYGGDSTGTMKYLNGQATPDTTAQGLSANPLGSAWGTAM